MRTLQPPFPNKITKPFLGTESVFCKPSLRKSPYGDYFNPTTAQASLLSPARTLSPKFPESHRIIASSVWPGGMGHMAPAPVSPLPFSPHVTSSGEVEAEAAVRDRCVPCQTWELAHSAGQALSKVRQQSQGNIEPLLLLLKDSCLLSRVCVCVCVCGV